VPVCSSFLLSFDRSGEMCVEMGDLFPIKLRPVQLLSNCVINFWCIIELYMEIITILEEASICQKCMEFGRGVDRIVAAAMGRVMNHVEDLYAHWRTCPS